MTSQRFRGEQPLWRFGLAPDAVAPFLEQFGWRELEQMGSQEFDARYVRPRGRDMPVSELERTVFAAKESAMTSG